MRVLIVHRYYWPDQTSCSGIVRALAAHLVQDLHTVTVLTSQPSYRLDASMKPRCKVESIDGVLVKRLNLPFEIGRAWKRVVNGLRLGLSVLLEVGVLRKYDLIVVTSIPPVLGGFFGALSSKVTGVRFIYYCMDIHPELGLVAGDYTRNRLFRLLLRLDDWSCRKAAPVLVHSEDMLKTLRMRPRGSEYDIQLMNNFAIPSVEEVVTTPALLLDTSSYKLTVVYAGNIGRFQEVQTIVEAMGLLSERNDVALIVMGDGVEKKALVARARELNANVHFLAYQPLEYAKRVILLADIGLVSLRPEIYKYAYPSKTMAYLEQGKPIIAMLECESELANQVCRLGCGFNVACGDYQGLATLLERLADDEGWKQPMSVAAQRVFAQKFSADVILGRWSNVVLTGVTKPSSD